MRRWLRSLFFKLRDPNYNEVHLRVNWQLPWQSRAQVCLTSLSSQCGWLSLQSLTTCPPCCPPAAQYILIGKLAAFRRNTLRVFKSKKVYQAGEVLVLGGEGVTLRHHTPALHGRQPHGD